MIQLEHVMATPPAGERVGDPHVHTHLFVDPELTAETDGDPHPLDVDSFRREVPMARALYERDLSERMMSAFAVRFDVREGSPTREIVGIDDEDLAAFAGRVCRPFAALQQLAPPSGQLAA